MNKVELTSGPVELSVRYRALVRINHLSDDIGLRMDELYKAVSGAGLQPAGPPSIIYPESTAPTDPTMTIELAAPVAADGDAGDLAGAGMRLHASGAEPRAHVTYRGPYHHLGAAHAALNDWLAGAPYRAAGPHRETYLVGPGDTDSPDAYVTDVSVPVASA